MNVQEVKDEVKRLEGSETTYENCCKLAVLYSIVDHLDGMQKTKITGQSFGSSEFLLAVESAPIDGVLRIMDEHMAGISVLYPKEYSAIIRKIKECSSVRLYTDN